MGAALLVLLFLGLGWNFIRANSQTSDEAVHLAAGYTYLTTGDFGLNPEHPPLIKELSALPILLRYRFPFSGTGSGPLAEWEIGINFLYRSPVAADALLALGRLPNLILGSILVGLIGWWSYRLWGPWAALLGMALAALDPNLIAHSSLVTTDLGPTLFIFLAVYAFWEYVRQPSWWLLATMGVATGLAVASKYSAVLLVGLLPLVAVGEWASGGQVRLPGNANTATVGRGARLLACILPLATVFGIAAMCVLATYGFHDVSSWWLGVTDVAAHQEHGHLSFLLGAYSNDGWWYYFIVAFFLKTPIGSLVLILASLVALRWGTPLQRRDGLFLLVPVIVVFALTSLARVDIGLRHVLPIYPFLFVAASRLATVRLQPVATRAVVFGLPLLWLAVSSLRVAPHQLAYFNEIAGGPDNGYKSLGDSNLDWGQDIIGLNRYVGDRHVSMLYLSYAGNAPPAAFTFAYQALPTFGAIEPPPTALMPAGRSTQLLAISVSNLQGTMFDHHDVYHWLLSRTPVATIGHSIFVYDLTGDAEAHIRLAEVYWQYGPQSDTGPELRQALAIEPTNATAARMLAALPHSP